MYTGTKDSLKSKLSTFIKEVHESDSITDISRLCADKKQPFFIIRAADPTEYMVALACVSRINPLSDDYQTVDDAVDLLFKLYHLWQIEYPPNNSKFFVFIAFHINL